MVEEFRVRLGGWVFVVDVTFFFWVGEGGWSRFLGIVIVIRRLHLFEHRYYIISFLFF